MGERRESLTFGGKVPIVIGVTGHRKLPDAEPPRLEREARSILERYLDAYPSTPLIVLSALAEGADRLIARVVLGLREGRKERLRLVVPLPMPADAYQSDFVEEGSRARFDEMLGQADLVRDIPLPRGVDVSSLRADKAGRSQQYVRLARFMAHHSHALIAMWTGQPSASKGGTADVVAYFTEPGTLGGETDANPLDLEEGLILEHVAVGSATASNPSAFRVGAPHGQEEATQVLKRIDAYNRDVDQRMASRSAELANATRSFLPADQLARVRGDVAPLLDAHVAADVLAAHVFKPHANRLAIAVSILGSIGLVCYELYAHHVVEEGWWPLAVYLGLLFVSFFLLRAARRRRIENKQQEYRSLAEALRVQTYWRIADVEDRAQDHYQKLLRSEVEWIRQALKGVGASLATVTLQPDEALERLDWVRAAWIDEGRGWLTRRAEEFHRLDHRAHNATKALLVASVLSVVVLIVLVWREVLDDAIRKELLLLNVAFLAAAGIVHQRVRLAGWSSLQQWYESLAQLYGRASERLAATIADSTRSREDRIASGRRILRALGIETLVENTGWLVHRRERRVGIGSGH